MIGRPTALTGLLGATLLVATVVIGQEPAAAAGPAATSRQTIPGPDGYAEPVVDIAVTALEPAVPQPSDLLVIEGSVTNVSDTPLVNVQALLRHNLNPLSSRTEIELLDTEPRLVWGSRPGHVFSEIAPSLAAGESADFRLEARLETACPEPEPGAPPCVQIQHPGVYVFGVDVREGNPNVPGARVDAGTALTLLPWLIDTAEPAVEVAMLWPVTGLPAVLPGGTLTGFDTSAVGPVGWLTALLDAPDDAPVTWVVDPDLLDTVAEVAASNDARSGAAQNWLDAFESRTADEDVWLLPFALPDIGSVDAQTGTELAATAMRLTRQTAGQLSVNGRTAAWPVEGGDPTGELAAYRSAGVTTAVVPSDAVSADATGPWLDLKAGDQDITGLAVDAGLRTAIEHAGDGVALRQRWLAETALAALDPLGAEARPLVASPSLGWQPSHQSAAGLIEAWTTTPWVEPVHLESIDSAPAPTTFAPVDSAPASPPSPTASAAAELFDLHYQYEILLTGPANGADFSAATVRAASAAWRGDPAAGQAYITEVSTDLRSRLSQVAVQVAPAVTLSSNTGAFPVNVVNQLDVPVTVRLDLQSANPQRMSVEPITAQRIEPGETEILRVTAEAVANGKVRVDLQLATIDGVPLGSPTYTVVNATAYGVIGWFLIAGAGVLFVTGLAVRTVRGRRRNGMPDEAAAPVPDLTPLEGANQ